MQAVDDFIEKILADKGINNDDIDPEIRAEMKEEMTNNLLREIDRAAILQLPEEKAIELDKIMQENPDFTGDQLAEFIQKAGVNLQEVALDVMVRFRGLYLGNEG